MELMIGQKLSPVRQDECSSPCRRAFVISERNSPFDPTEDVEKTIRLSLGQMGAHTEFVDLHGDAIKKGGLGLLSVSAEEHIIDAGLEAFVAIFYEHSSSVRLCYREGRRLRGASNCETDFLIVIFNSRSDIELFGSLLLVQSEFVGRCSL